MLKNRLAPDHRWCPVAGGSIKEEEEEIRPLKIGPGFLVPVPTSVGDLWHFGADPDLRIRTVPLTRVADPYAFDTDLDPAF